jgi:hypothetical protein
MKRLINTFILGSIAVYFIFDTFVYGLTGWSISGNMNAWLHADNFNLILYFSALILLTAHFYWGKYDKQ